MKSSIMPAIFMKQPNFANSMMTFSMIELQNRKDETISMTTHLSYIQDWNSRFQNKKIGFEVSPKLWKDL